MDKRAEMHGGGLERENVSQDGRGQEGGGGEREEVWTRELRGKRSEGRDSKYGKGTVRQKGAGRGRKYGQQS